jgi:hypothetical protein
MCEVQEIRYQHAMTHPDYPETLLVGCICAEHMSEDYVGPRLRERQLRNAAAARRRKAERERREQLEYEARVRAFEEHRRERQRQEEEQRRRRYEDDRREWVQRWKRSHRGNEYRKTNGQLVSIFPDYPHWWGVCILNDTAGTKVFLRGFATPEAAKLAAFDRLFPTPE